jgi:predicted DNA-binding protein YlxM (UPF0122 family)
MEFVAKLLVAFRDQQKADERYVLSLMEKAEAAYKKIETVHDRMTERRELMDHLERKLEAYKRAKEEEEAADRAAFTVHFGGTDRSDGGSVASVG